jgi:nucleoside-diphosphate-sugar epimerase
MKSVDVLILGCGFTGSRVARRMQARGARVTVTTRDASRLQELAKTGVQVLELDATRDVPHLHLPEGTLVLHSIPVIEKHGNLFDPTPGLLKALGRAPARIVYLSATGVYGEAHDVDEHTPIAPRSIREHLRVSAEQAVAQGPWSSMILRPAAIYGAGRGIHVSMLEGRFQLSGDGGNYVSRIHVDDLAAHAEAALLSVHAGAWPVGDEEPCTSREIAEYCSALLNLPMPESVNASELHATRRSDRRVNGRAIRELLGITLRYPSYRVGIPGSLSQAERIPE